MRSLCVGCVFLSLLVGWLPARAAETSGRPARQNIVFLLADDLRYDAVGFMGDRLARTPRLDALAQRGTVFQNAFVTTSICAVSRASIFAGQYARRHGIHDFKTSFSPEAFARTYPALLRSEGYRVGFIGKYGLGSRMPEEAFDYWRGFPGQGAYFAKDEPGVHLTRRMGDQAVQFLRESEGGKPFCLSVSFKSPHAQDGAEREFPPDPRDEALFGDVTFPVPRTADERHFQALPAFARESEGRRRWARRFATPEMFQRTVRDYYRLVTGMDREIGRIIEALGELGLADDTLIVFTSDNGFFFGERGMAGKWLMYEESIRVPLLIVDPRQKDGGRRVEEIALNIDLAPTLLDYAKVEIPSEMQGRSLRPFVRGEDPADWRDDFFYEHLTLPKMIPPSEGVRTTRWAYLRWVGPDPHVEELYDVQADPLQEHDLAESQDHRDTLEQLRSRWETLRMELE